MPYEKGSHADCPSDKPIAVKKVSDGKLMGCHANEEDANAQLAALHASEKQMTMTREELVTTITRMNVDDRIKSYLSKQLEAVEDEGLQKFYDDMMEWMPPEDYVPFGVTDFSQLGVWQREKEKSHSLKVIASQFQQIVENVFYDDGITDKSGHIMMLTEQLAAELDAANRKEKALSKVARAIKGKTDEPQRRPFMVWKEKDGTLAWLAVYSNNFIDDDVPPDIISKASHQRFVDKVSAGEYPPPELWLFHEPSLKFGEGKWVAFDDSGFALAGGTIDNNDAAHELAKELAGIEDIAMSHSMPLPSIKRDADDPHVIIEHQTIEVSPLPSRVAASKLTDFQILKEATMGIDPTRRQILENEWGVSSKTLDAVEDANKNRADLAKDLGLESKESETAVAEAAAEVEVGEAPAEEAVEEEPAEEKEETKAEVEAKPTAEMVEKSGLFSQEQRKELAEGILAANEPIQAMLTAQTELLTKLVDRVVSLEGGTNSQVKKALDEMPAASLAAMVRGNSVVGKEETKVDRRTALGKSKPEENDTEMQVPVRTGIGILDKMLAGQPAEQEAEIAAQ